MSWCSDMHGDGPLMRDRDIRLKLASTSLRRHRHQADTVILHEFGINHGSNRVDIAVINGKFVGFEIKSDTDNLNRLKVQAEAYSQVFDLMTLVCVEKFVPQAIDIVPEWWGLKVPLSGKRCAITDFRTERRAAPNPSVDTLAVARLLWKSEVISALELVAGITRGVRSKPREQLYELLVATAPRLELLRFVRQAIKARRDWRPDAQRT